MISLTMANGTLTFSSTGSVTTKGLPSCRIAASTGAPGFVIAGMGLNPMAIYNVAFTPRHGTAMNGGASTWWFTAGF